MVSFRCSQTSRRLGLIAVFAICVCCVLALGACSSSSSSSSSKTTSFTDSCGRTVDIPTNVTKVAPSGSMAQQVLMTFDKTKLCGLAVSLSESEEKYFGIKSSDYTTFGALYGTKGSFNKEAVASSGAELVIDIGESKSGIVEDLDKLQETLGIPCIHIEATVETYDEVYTTLGKVLNNESRGSELSKYCKSLLSSYESNMKKVSDDKRVSVAFLVDETHALAKGSYQATVVDMIANNAVVVDNASSKGTGNEISLEQLAVWNPEVLIIQSEELYNKIADDPAWSTLLAVQNGEYYLVPNIPYGWLNNPASVNQLLGLIWLPHLLYSDIVGADMKDDVKSYFKTMYGYSLTDDEYKDMMKNSLPA